MSRSGYVHRPDYGIRNSSDPLRVVSIEDPAIDIATTGDGIIEYGCTRDARHLVFHPGAHPCWYTLRPLSRKALAIYVNAVEGREDRARRALACALERIEGHPEHGNLTPPTGPKRDVGDVIDEDWLDENVEPYGAILELGALVYDRAHVPKGQRRACAPPPGSFRRLAEWSRAAEMSLLLPTSAPPTATLAGTSASTGNATAAASDSPAG